MDDRRSARMHDCPKVQLSRTNIKGAEHIEKVPELMDVLAQLGHAVPGLEVRDHWDSDSCAVGIAAPWQPSFLLYVLCFDQPPGRVSYSIEDDEVTHDEAEDAPVAELIAAVQRHLAVQTTAR